MSAFDTDGGDEVIFSVNDSAGLKPLLPTALGEYTPVDVVAMVLDAQNEFWLCCSRYFDCAAACKTKGRIHADWVFPYEVLKETETRWHKLDKIVGSCFVIECSRQVFVEKIRRKALPQSVQVFFHREI